MMKWNSIAVLAGAFCFSGWTAQAQNVSIRTGEFHVEQACKLFQDTPRKNRLPYKDKLSDTTATWLPPAYLIIHLENHYGVNRRVSHYHSEDGTFKSPQDVFAERIRADVCNDKFDRTIDFIENEGNPARPAETKGREVPHPPKYKRYFHQCAYPMAEQLAGDLAAYRIRTALLKVFNSSEAHQPQEKVSRPGNTHFAIIGRTSEPGSVAYPEWQSLGTLPKQSGSEDYGHFDRLADEAKWLSAFINAKKPEPDAGSKSPVDIYCFKRKAETQTSEDAIGIFANLSRPGVDFADQSLMRLTDEIGRNTGQPKVDRNFKTPPSSKYMLVKDADQFAAAKPEGASIGTTFAGDTSDEDFKANLAFGLVFSRSDKNLRKKPWACLIDENCTTIAGAKRTYSIYGEYEQSPSTITIQDPEGRQLSDGTPLTARSAFADGTFRAGLRIDYEDFPEYETPRDNQSLFNLGGKRPPGNKMSMSLETFTDNFLDMQGQKIDFAFSPRYNYLDMVKLGHGYRHPVRLNTTPIATFNDIKFEWDANVILDYIDYSRQPLDRNFGAETRRRDLNEFFRIGSDASIKLSGRAPFELIGNPSGIELLFKRAFREPIDNQNASAVNDEITFTLKDLAQSRLDFSLSYFEGEDILTFRDKEYFSLKVTAKVE